ncbi:MAG: DUF3108 domain-containing protein [Bacteroidetes bacterium]|nr:MAG: DUF3108 domain-containing protein [Bacteroidota bacterium]
MQKCSNIVLALAALFFFSYAVRTSGNKADVPPIIECDINNDAFFSGEEIKYEISYNWGLIWLDAGQVTFKVEMAEHKGIPCYKLSGIGGTYPSYDWIYKVRDRFECWVDTTTLKPFRYIRDVKEGGRTFYNECFFNYQKQKAYCVTLEKKKSPRMDTVPISLCSFDPLTMIYFSRNINYSKYTMNDTIPISLFLDNKIYPLYIRYLGKDKLKMAGKTMSCIKFSPLLVAGTIFKGGEGMKVWATDDMNKIPLHVEAPIMVGTVKANVVSWKGLRNKTNVSK